MQIGAIREAEALLQSMAAALGKGRLATGDPDSVPVGRYAKEALTTLGVWSGVEDHLVRADSVRSGGSS